MQTPKVSIVVPCYNQAHYIDESLNSVLIQTYTNWECLVVNDGSTDNSEELIKKWLGKDSRFKLLNKQNGGVSCARNLGIKQSQSEYILTLDADDKYERTFLEKAIEVLFQNQEIGIVSSWGRYFTNEKQLHVFKSTAQSVEDFLFCNAVNMGSSLFRKKCWEYVNGYDENPANGYEDWDFYLRISSLGWKVHIIEEVLFLYRQNLNSRSAEMYKKHNETQKYIYLKNKDIYCAYYENLIDRFLLVSDLEKASINKFKNTIDYKLGAALLTPLRIVKWFFLKHIK